MHAADNSGCSAARNPTRFCLVRLLMQVGFYESVLAADNTCYHYASQCPPPVDLLFMNDIVGDSDDYFEAGARADLARVIKRE